LGGREENNSHFRGGWGKFRIIRLGKKGSSTVVFILRERRGGRKAFFSHLQKRVTKTAILKGKKRPLKRGGEGEVSFLCYTGGKKAGPCQGKSISKDSREGTTRGGKKSSHQEKKGLRPKNLGGGRKGTYLSIMKITALANVCRIKGKIHLRSKEGNCRGKGVVKRGRIYHGKKGGK